MSPAPKKPGSNQNGRRSWLWLLAAAVWTLVIWSNSLRPAEQSDAQSGQVLQWLLPLLRRTGLPETIWHTLVRKLAHMTEFALLGLLWTGGLIPRGRAGCLDAAIRAAGLCLLTGMTDETIQLFIPGRSGQVTDVWIDFLGAALGLLLALLVRYLAGRRRNAA